MHLLRQELHEGWRKPVLWLAENFQARGGTPPVIFPDVPLERWKAKYRLPDDVEPFHCQKCGKSYPLDVPIMTQGMAGLSSKIHECGQGFCAVILTPATDKAKAFWRRVLSGR